MGMRFRSNNMTDFGNDTTVPTIGATVATTATTIVTTTSCPDKSTTVSMGPFGQVSFSNFLIISVLVISLVIFLIIICLCCCCRNRRHKRRSKSHSIRSHNSNRSLEIETPTDNTLEEAPIERTKSKRVQKEPSFQDHPLLHRQSEEYDVQKMQQLKQKSFVPVRIINSPKHHHTH